MSVSDLLDVEGHTKAHHQATKDSCLPFLHKGWRHFLCLWCIGRLEVVHHPFQKQTPQKKACARQAEVEVRGNEGGNQWLCEPRCAQPVVRFSTQLNSSYMAMAMAPTTSKPADARPICMEEPAEISR